MCFRWAGWVGGGYNSGEGKGTPEPPSIRRVGSYIQSKKTPPSNQLFGGQLRKFFATRSPLRSLYMALFRSRIQFGDPMHVSQLFWPQKTDGRSIFHCNYSPHTSCQSWGSDPFRPLPIDWGDAGASRRNPIARGGSAMFLRIWEGCDHFEGGRE